MEKEKHLISKPWFGYLAVFIISAALYTATCAPTVLWQDSGLFQYRIWHNDLQGNLGLALAHTALHHDRNCRQVHPAGQFCSPHKPHLRPRRRHSRCKPLLTHAAMARQIFARPDISG